MRKKAITLSALIMVFYAYPTQGQSATILFKLQGVFGIEGLSHLNEVPIQSPASVAQGGEVGAGITYDDITKLLTINVGWGSSNFLGDRPFIDLAGGLPATAAHLHGPANQSQTGGILVDLFSGLTPSGTNGGISMTVDASSFETALLSGNTYINVHTNLYPAGEIRGNLIPIPFIIPEPSTSLLTLSGMLLICSMRNRKSPRP